MKNQEPANENDRKNRCYVCKESLVVTHEHYVKLCQPCGEYNEQKRLAKHDLDSYTALITGGRTKIGYHTALRLLRDGSRVILTTRFPYDALQRYIKEPDFENWCDRIHIYGLDFRQIERVEMFAQFIDKEFPYIDIIINNAAQTVRMLDEEYQALALNEAELQRQIAGNQQLQLMADKIPVSHFVKSENETKGFQQLQQMNHEQAVMNHNPLLHNSWTAHSHQISVVEMLEVQLINVTAPFLINTKLKDAMLRSPHQNRFIVNVSASEGRFNMRRKGGYHVHTNMAKASLNMMTLTMSKEYKKHRIFITSVDPGWVSNQFPDQVKNDRKIQLPLDFDDAAARICDPVYEGKDVERPLTGVFLKDYQQVDW
ncbi:short chain dehydrogenase [Paenibacillus tianmuensis]|uniref:Short chain dehydrogenase n=1 Tax=Paenibacillus tianmuensis TaxID=624147 RepID=A0A1G4PE87_9BACL|nr:SDR family oxidoreductase [Paenibacillus tianmuensis]SCW30349.1 short chain dehydrogenase [Paenibacillus tianmuensis]